jgi:hypothetical protein
LESLLSKVTGVSADADRRNGGPLDVGKSPEAGASREAPIMVRIRLRTG